MKAHLLVLCAALSLNACGQSSSPSPPLVAGRAELLNTLKSPTLKVGDLFYLRTVDSWRQGDCTIPPHTTLTGRIESLSSSPHDTILSIRFFEIPCTEAKSRLMTPLLVSIKAPDPDRYNKGYNASAPQTAMLRGIFPSEMDAGSHGPGSMIHANDSTSTNAQDAAELLLVNNLPLTEKPMRAGEVRGYRGVALTLSNRENLDAKLASAHKIVLDRATEFAFTYAAIESGPEVSVASPPPARNIAPSVKPASAHALPEEPEDVCGSSGCRQLASVTDTTVDRALWAVSLGELGYQYRPSQAIIGPDSSASVHFLGEDQILLAFTRHVLLPRSSDADAWNTHPRSVRAVLISRTDGHVLRVKDWTVSDDIGPFVWSLGNGVVIAHVGHDLVRFGPDLAIEQRVPLVGPLLLLSASPKGNLLLAATVHEKHTEKEHAQIAKVVGPDVPIDEEYDLTGLNDAFQVTGARRVTVKPLRPALLQASMISARPLHGVEWLLEESTWQGQTKRFAHFRSSCPLKIQSFPGDLVFIQGCTPIEARTWYRVLNAQGATLFKGSGLPTDLIQQAESSYDGRLFAIALSHFNNRAVDRRTTLQTGEFTDLTVTVYDTATGKQFFAARPRQGSAQADTFSLAPSGSALAVLTSAALQLFPVPALTAKK